MQFDNKSETSKTSLKFGTWKKDWSRCASRELHAQYQRHDNATLTHFPIRMLIMDSLQLALAVVRRFNDLSLHNHETVALKFINEKLQQRSNPADQRKRKAVTFQFDLVHVAQKRKSEANHKVKVIYVEACMPIVGPLFSSVASTSRFLFDDQFQIGEQTIDGWAWKWQTRNLNVRSFNYKHLQTHEH